MEILQPIITNNLPSFFELFRYSFSSLIEITKIILLTDPINIIIFTLIIFFIVFRIVQKIKGKLPFQQTYQPLQHQPDYLEDLRLAKKEIRDIQTEMMDFIKKAKDNAQTTHSQKVNQQKMPNSISKHSQNLINLKNEQKQILTEFFEKQKKQFEKVESELLKQLDKLLVEEQERKELSENIEKQLNISMSDVLEKLEKINIAA